MKSLNILFFMLLSSFAFAQTLADFENLNVQVGGHAKDAGPSHLFRSGNVELPNFYDAEFDSWSGWAISAATDVSTPGYSNQYSAIAGGGANGSNTYAVTYIYGSEVMNLTGNAVGGVVQGMYITNSTYAYLSMLDGDAFAKKFGGITGNDPDFYKVTVRKYLNDQIGSDSVEFYLADYRFADNSQDYIINDWTYLDLTSLGNVDYLEFTLSSSDVGAFGINTPTYFCVDDVTTSDTPLAAHEEAQDLNIKAWPNPVNDNLQIAWNETSEATACLSTVYGKVIQQRKLIPGQNQLDVSELPSGTFTLRITLGERSYSQLFIKK
jgi:Domain of unknown function (DUF4465)/Secretion system C-terminal sorting domain